jgi:thioredoxin-related protein
VRLIQKFLIFITALSTFTLALPALACTDGVLYKQCQNQWSIYNAALEKAEQQEKFLVVTLGYENCPWCQSLGKMFNDFDSQQTVAASQFEFVEIAAYSYDRFAQKFTEVPSGLALSQQLLSRLSSPTAINGFPVMFVLNPKTGKASMIETGGLEQNDETNGIYGHDVEKVTEALYRGLSTTLSVE